jgi:ribosomal protein S27AE
MIGLMPSRFSESAHQYDFLDEILVRCPRCGARVVVRGGRLACGGCALVQDWGRSVALGPEPHLGVGLWLQAPCCGGKTLWALNERHLDWLEGYVAAEFRERPLSGITTPGASSSRMARKLPAWLKSAKHRDEVLRAIARLRATL